MFNHHKEHKKGHHGSSLPIAIFRFILSLVIFAFLLGGTYSAYKHFSGYDPLKLDTENVLENFTSKEKILNLFFGLLTVDSKDIKSKIVPGSEEEGVSEVEPTSNKPQGNPLFKFALVADSHNDNKMLAKALSQAKSSGELKFIVGLGDFTEVGTLDELKNSKQVFDENGVRYFVTAGDHDLWDARDKQKEAIQNFIETFGKPYQSFTVNNIKFIILNNADNYLGMGSEQIDWLKNELAKSRSEGIAQTVVFMHEPLFHPSSDRYMGKVTPALKDEAKQVINILKTGGVSQVFFGDIHFFTKYQEPESGLLMTTIGAVTSERNPQLPRYAIVTVYDSGALDVADIEIK